MREHHSILHDGAYTVVVLYVIHTMCVCVGVCGCVWVCVCVCALYIIDHFLVGCGWINFGGVCVWTTAGAATIATQSICIS